jgi:putative ABC transport system ATP-binding protein
MPDEGDVRFAGRTLKSMPEAELLEIRRREIGFVFQTFGLIPILTAAENVGMPLRLIKTATSEREARVKSALDAVGLTRQGPQLPSQLSGGEQQRVAIARAIVSEPRLIIADEPTGQLDSRTGGQIIDLLIAVARTRGTAMIVASHDPNLVDSADQHLHLADGRLA